MGLTRTGPKSHAEITAQEHQNSVLCGRMKSMSIRSNAQLGREGPISGWLKFQFVVLAP